MPDKKREVMIMSIREMPFTCERDGMTIRGMQYLPENFNENEKYPVVIVSHGFTDNYTCVADYCRDFAGIGYAAFSFSFCGGGCRGEDERTKSDGNTTDMTISSEITDLIAVKNYARNQPFADADHLILAGYSQGGFVSGLTAARCGDEIEKLILISPALCIPDHARRGCLGGSSYDPRNVPETLDCGKTVLGRAFHEDVAGMEPFLELSAYQGPVLLLLGLEDPVVHYSYGIRAKASYGKGQCHLQLIRNLGHGYDKGQHESAFASIRQFLAGKTEILTIRTIITREETFTEGDSRISHIYFTGYCDTKYFQGTVMPEGCDVREQCAGAEDKARAEYTLTGLDIRGEACSVHIVNQWNGTDWKPVIKTDSAALAWMNHADLTAVLEYGSGGPTVRIFASPEEFSECLDYS